MKNSSQGQMSAKCNHTSMVRRNIG